MTAKPQPIEAPGRQREARRRRLLAAAGLTLVLAILGGVVALRGGDDAPPPAPDLAPIAAAGEGDGAADPLAWDAARRDVLERRAALGLGHPIFALSPGGVIASARRTARWREQIDAAAHRAGVDPAVLEAMIMLESAGRPRVMAGPTPEAASGLAQILPATATELLGMRVDLPASIALERRIERAERRGEGAHARRLRREQVRVDQRFDPRAALRGAARYLAIAQRRFGRTDLAVEAYHMGIGNLTNVVRAYVSPADASGPVADVVSREGLSYAELYFNSSPLRNPEAYDILSQLGDDSANYYWKVLAAEEIVRWWRTDREALAEAAALQTAKATAEELFHPEAETQVFATADDVDAALQAGELVPLPDEPGRLGFRLSPQVGELAHRLERDPALYAALRPEALAALVYMAARVRAISGAERPLTVTSAVRDSGYQELLRATNPEAAQGYSLHTTGWSFDIARDYASDAQAAAFQFVLDRLRALAVIDYAKEPDAIHVTVSEHARDLLPR